MRTKNGNSHSGGKPERDCDRVHVHEHEHDHDGISGRVRDRHSLIPVFNTLNSLMKKYMIMLAGVALLAACEKSETTTVNPPGENKTESNTTVVKEKEPSTSTKTESSSTTNTGTGGTSTSTTTTSSPSP